MGCGRRTTFVAFPVAAAFSALIGLGVVVRLAPDHHPPPSRLAVADAAHDSPLRSVAPTHKTRGWHGVDGTKLSTTASGAIFCQSGSDLVVGILASPSARSTTSRQTIRDTWARFPTPKHTVTLRFLLALNERGNVPDHLQAESDAKGDLIFLHTLDKYENLSRKVQLFFKWVVDACPSAIHILKTDDDSFVRLDELAKELERQPTEQVSCTLSACYVTPGTGSASLVFVRTHFAARQPNCRITVRVS
jgi:hypothetical protein